MICIMRNDKKALEDEIQRLRVGIEAITMIRPPAFSNLSPHQVIAMSPTVLIKHCNDLLGKNKFGEYDD